MTVGYTEFEHDTTAASDEDAFFLDIGIL